MSVPVSTNTASFGARVIAFVIDLVLLESIHSFLFLLLAINLIQITYIEPLAFLTFIISCLLTFFVRFVFLHMMYFTLFHAWSGQTIGKMIMGIRVVTNDNEIACPSVAFLRWSGYILSFVPLAIGFLWAAVDKDQCAWHDRLSQTRVISS